MLFFSTFALLCLLSAVALAAQHKDYYDLLHVDRDVSNRDLKKAYRRLARKVHPDKNPDDEEAAKSFVEISEAYEVLSDDNLRRVYNQYGHEGVQQHRRQQQGGSRNPFDMFSQFFGGGGGGSGPFGGGQRRGPSMEVRIAFPLKDFYTGAVHDFTIEKQIICDACDGSGAEDGARDQCDKCNGHGIVIQKHMLAPGIFQQMQMQCDRCGGQGSTIKHKCKKCHGERVVKADETFDVNVERGMPYGARVVFEGEADESPDYAAGDITVNIIELEPSIASSEAERTDGAFFRRRDHDLFWREVLSLREAWMGDWTRNLTHLDGHVVRLSRRSGEVVQPGTVQAIQGEGMPVWKWDGNGPEFGNLYIEYQVVLPDQMDRGMKKEFSALWDKWRANIGIDLFRDSGRPDTLVSSSPSRDEL